MATKQQSNIESSTYKGLLVLTMVLIAIFVFRSLLFSYEIHTYDETDKTFAEKKLFPKDNSKLNLNTTKLDSNGVKLDSNSTTKTKKNDQKNIIKDLTVNQKIVNINSSLKDDLIKLPGIGPKTAEKIIKYRMEHGDFLTKDDLIKVKGIGPVKLEKIKNLIKLK